MTELLGTTQTRAHPNTRVLYASPAGQAPPPTLRPGDIGLVRATTTKGRGGATTMLGKAIQSGERQRYGNTDWARWTHAFLVLNSQGGIEEAIESGVHREHISKYRNHDYMVVSPIATPEQRALAVAFANAHDGAKYGILNFAGLVGQSLFGRNFPAVHEDSQFICSGFVARATEKCIVTYQRASDDMMPGDLAYYWHAHSGEPEPAPGFFGRFLDRLATVCRIVTRL